MCPITDSDTRPLLCLLFIILLSTGCNKKNPLELVTAEQNAGQAAAEKLYVDESLKGLSTVRPLDDADNPYASEYGAWDYWISEHIVELPSRDTSSSDNVILAKADEKGYLIPLVSWEGEIEKAASEGRSRQFLSSPKFQTVYAQGEMPEQMRQRSQEAIWREKARYYPTIPHWLSASPPDKSMILPDGRVVTLDEVDAPGSHVKTEPALIDKAVEQPIASLYSATGELLMSKEGGHGQVHLLLNPDYPEIIDEALEAGWNGFEQRTDHARSGYLEPEKTTGELIFIYDWYEGRKVPAASPRDEHYFTYITATQLQSIAALQ